MANIRYIHIEEDQIIYAKNCIQEVKAAYTLELRNNDSKPIPANRDSWGTLYTNAVSLRTELDKLLQVMEKEFSI